MAEAGAGADIIHPNDPRMGQTVSDLRTALGTAGYTASELSSMTKNDMVHADEISSERNPVTDRQDLGSPPFNVCLSATEGEPGELLPAGCVRPLDTAAMANVVADPDTAWEEDSYVLIYDDEPVHWDGNSWEDGAAPEPE
jgi:hypothetical protein